MDTFLQDEIKEQDKKKPGTWASMNYIQRAGVIGGCVLFLPSLSYDGRLGMYAGVAGWTILLFGYVAGSLWKVRHAVHFWWSLFFASLVHAALLPIYAYLVDKIKNAPGHEGKAYIYLAGGLVSVEAITLIYLLKHAALWLHKQIGKKPHSNDLSL
jgi:hypothetical protein